MPSGRLCSICELPYPKGEYRFHRRIPAHQERLTPRERLLTGLERWHWHDPEREARRVARYARILELYHAGAPYSVIAEELGTTRQYPYRELKRHGDLRPRPARHFRRACFLCGEPYVIWRTHAETSAHRIADTEVQEHTRRITRKATS